MRIFNPSNHTHSETNKRTYAYFELAYTLVDFSAAALFVIGSLLFFSEKTTYIATWLFLIGSILFGMKPTIRLVREICYLRAGDYDKINEG